ncbi:unnamed protein product [Durusdinium trenchii]|uniref:Uncharacterized protein n=2 Tax=Durusdinium trenchii TaxID=1381693 RepID=A0ABP0IR07_9DINO
MHRRARFRGDDLGLNCRQLCISGSAPALQVGGSSRSSTPAKAKRRSGAPHAGLVGQLSSTFAAPLEECSTLENLHRVALQISGRLSSHRLAFAALVAAVSGRCTSMLRKGWSMDEAMEAIPLLGDLWQAGLLYVPGDTARTAVASALATLVSGGRRETPPGSAFGCALSRPSSTGSGVAARENMEQRLKRWCRSCEIFESAASMDLLTREGGAVVEEQLYEELKRTLAGAREEDLRKAASKIKLGSVPLCRACGLLAKARRPHPSSQISTPGSSDSESVKAASDAAAETISGIAFEVVRNTETASGETATSARAALEEHGVVERRAGHERITSTSRSPTSTRSDRLSPGPDSGPAYSPLSSSWLKSRDEGPTALPEFDGLSVSHGEHIIAAARKANSQLSALEGGLLRLEAARQEMRRAKALHPLPPATRMAIGAVGLATEERRCSTRT